MTAKITGRVIAGFILLGFGIVMILDRTGVIDTSLGTLISTWWPSVVIVVGVLLLVRNPSVIWGSLLLILLGAMWQVDRLWPEVQMWTYFFPGLLVVIGISLLVRLRPSARAARSGPLPPVDATDAPSGGNPGATPQFATPRGDHELDRVQSSAIFSGAQHRSSSTAFQGGSISAIFGAQDLDLRGACLAPNAKLSVFCLFGGADIKVPRGWRVEVSGTPIFGGVDDKTKPPGSPDAPVFHIDAVCIFGGVNVVH